jgi:hypothetical protein
MTRIAMTLLAAVLAAVACEPVSTPAPNASSAIVVETPAGTVSETPGTRASSPRSFTINLVGNFDDATEARIADRSGLVHTAEPGAASIIPVEPYLLPAAVNPTSGRDWLVLYWSQLRCRKATDLELDPLDAGLLVTIAPIGQGDCDTIGSTFELDVSLEREIRAQDVFVRQVSEDTGAVRWVARSPANPGATVQITDAALALARVRLDFPAVMAPSDGVEMSRSGRTVSIAWVEPCGSESSVEITGTPQAPVLTVETIRVEECLGTATRQVTLNFIDEEGAAALLVRLADER